MNTLKFSKNSWHYKLSQFGTEFGRNTSDICAYTRSCTKGLFMFTLASAAVSFLAASAGNFLAWIAAGFAWCFVDIDALGVAVPAILVIGLAVLVVVVIQSVVGQLKEQARQNNAPPSFVRSAYKSWKGKYCVKVDVE